MQTQVLNETVECNNCIVILLEEPFYSVMNYLIELQWKEWESNVVTCKRNVLENVPENTDSSLQSCLFFGDLLFIYSILVLCYLMLLVKCLLKIKKHAVLCFTVGLDTLLCWCADIVTISRWRYSSAQILVGRCLCVMFSPCLHGHLYL